MIARDRDFLREYVSKTPLALAFERTIECKILAGQRFERPVLDLGCGDGLFASILFEEKVDTGIDPNSTELEHARRLDCYAELIECKGDSIPKPSGHYCTVFSNSVLEHIQDLAPVLAEANRLLAPGGVLFLTVPTDGFERGSVVSRILSLLGLRGTDRAFRRFYNRFWAHYHCYTPDQWSSLVSNAGFRVEVVRPYDPINICTVNDALVPFGLPSFVLKRWTNEWVVFPRLRARILTPVIAVARQMLEGADHSKIGGLVFIAARKS
jgi:SAM-dependent methyltransferase